MALCEHQVIEAQDASAALEHLYNNAQALMEYSQRSYRRATMQKYQWSTIGEQWAELLEDVLKQDRRRNLTCQ
jgi:glycosyltransferase involved in cell wall biosynthesis